MGLDMKQVKDLYPSIQSRVKTSRVTYFCHINLSGCLLVCIWWIFGPTFVELPAPESKIPQIFAFPRALLKGDRKRDQGTSKMPTYLNLTSWWLIWPCTNELWNLSPILFSKLVQMCPCSWELSPDSSPGRTDLKSALLWHRNVKSVKTGEFLNHKIALVHLMS